MNSQEIQMKRQQLTAVKAPRQDIPSSSAVPLIRANIAAHYDHVTRKSLFPFAHSDKLSKFLPHKSSSDLRDQVVSGGDIKFRLLVITN